jgi:hypothetical protein
VDLLVAPARVGGAVVAHHQHHVRAGRVQQARAAVDDPSVSPTLRWPPNSAAPPSSMTWPAAYCTDTEPSGLNTIHQTVTAWPACSPVVRSEKDVPLPVRVRVEVPTGLVVWVAAPARLTTTTDSGPMRARATRIRRFTTLSPLWIWDRTERQDARAISASE